MIPPGHSLALPAPLPTLPCVPGERRDQGSCCPGWGGVPRAPTGSTGSPCSQKERWERFQAAEMPCRGARQLMDAVPGAWLMPRPQLQAWPPSHGDDFPRKLCLLPARAPTVPWPLTRDAFSPKASREEAQQSQDSFHPCPGADDPKIRPSGAPSCVWV